MAKGPSAKQLNGGQCKILPCTCVNAFQDEIYKGLRLHNAGTKGFRCTVCGRSK